MMKTGGGRRVAEVVLKSVAENKRAITDQHEFEPLLQETNK